MTTTTLFGYGEVELAELGLSVGVSGLIRSCFIAIAKRVRMTCRPMCARP